MKKRIAIAIVLTLVMVFGVVSPASAAPPVKSYCEITTLEEGSITFDWGWYKIGVHSYRIIVHSAKSSLYPEMPTATGTIYNSGMIYLDGRTTNTHFTDVVVTDALIVPKYMYYAEIQMFGKSGTRILKHGRPYDYQTLHP